MGKAFKKGFVSSAQKLTQLRGLNKLAENLELMVKEFVTDAIEKQALVVLMIDDFSNIHTIRRPAGQKSSAARNMTTILVKRFCDASTMPIRHDTITHDGTCQELLLQVKAKMFHSLSATFVMSIPYWIRTAFFDPEMERSRIELHNYQEHLTGMLAIKR